MKIQFIVCLLLTPSTAYAGETEYESGHKNTLEYYEAMSQQMARETKYKEPSPTATDEQTQTRDFTPSSEIADEAFSKRDYKTALKHYEALGEEGDGRASMVTGLIYGAGVEGIEADKAKAAAWFKRSSDQGETAGADLYAKMDKKNELNEEEKIEAKNLIHEFRESDAKLMKDQQTMISDSYSSGTSSSISGIGSRQYTGKSEFVQTSSANIYAVATDTEASFSPTRLSRGNYSYQPEKALLSHFLPARE